MSFSFVARAGSTIDLVDAAAAEMSKVVTSQPDHAHDAESVMDVVKAYAGLVREPTKDEELVMNVHGSISWDINVPVGEDRTYNTAVIGVSLSIHTKTAATPS